MSEELILRRELSRLSAELVKEVCSYLSSHIIIIKISSLDPSVRDVDCEPGSHTQCDTVDIWYTIFLMTLFNYVSCDCDMTESQIIVKRTGKVVEEK